jgi:hypothetical protein
MSRQEIPLGVSLSGGGFRATLFSLGVLYYLVDSGLARSLRSVVSVSGGSVANAFVAQECDLGTVTSGELESIVRRMARRIGTTGLLRTGPAMVWLISLGPAGIATLAGLILLPTTLLRLAALATGAGAVALVLHLRGFALGRAMRQVFFSRGGRPKRPSK